MSATGVVNVLYEKKKKGTLTNYKKNGKYKHNREFSKMKDHMFW